MLEVHDLGKKLTRDLQLARRHGVSDILRDLRFGTSDPSIRPGEFWALRGVDLTVGPGEALGVIGHNGAGKSTLLRVLHGLTRPDTGSVTIRGTHAALLDLGAPFNKVLSGRENIETAAAIHGVRRNDARPLIDAVAEFSELADVLDAPMWSYSTGMQMRLGFAVAMQLNPSLLLVDEVIAVGDIAFQRKCVSHIRQHLSRGGSLVLVSHDLWMIQVLCDRCIVLSEGSVITDAPPNHAISTYLRTARKGEVFIPRSHGGLAPAGKPAADITATVVSCTGPSGEPPRNGDRVSIGVTVAPTETRATVVWYVDVLTPNRQVCVARLQPAAGTDAIELRPEGTVLSLVIPQLPLLPGTFYLSVHLEDESTGETIGASEDPFPFEVLSRHNRLDTLAQLPGAGALSSVEASYTIQNRTKTAG